MPLDPSIPLGVSSSAAPPMDPMNFLLRASQLRAMGNQNALFQQTFVARKAMGPIFQQSIDPEGNIDYNKALTLAGQNPDAAFLVPEMANQIAQRELTQAQMRGQLETQAIDGLKGLQGAFAQGLTNPEKFPTYVKSFLSTLPPQLQRSLGPVAQSYIDSVMSPPSDGSPFTMDLVKQRLASHAAGAGWNADQLANAAMAKPLLVDQGGQKQPGAQNPLTGAVTPAGGALPNTMTQAERLTPVQTGVDDRQNPLMTLRGDLEKNGLTSPATTGGGNGLPIKQPTTAPAAPGKGSFQAGPDEYFKGRAKDMNDYEKNLDDRVLNGSQMAKNVDELVGTMKDVTIGGGADSYQKLGQGLQAFGVSNDTVDKWANGSLAKSEVIDKVSLNNAMSQLKQQLTGVGGSRLAVQEFVAYLNKNPGLTTDPRAAIQVFNLWKQYYDRDVKEQDSFDKFKLGQPTGDKSLDAYAGGSKDITRWPAVWNHSDFMKSFAPGGPVNATGVRGTGGKQTVKWTIKDGEMVPESVSPQ